MASFEKRGGTVRAVVFFHDGKKTKTFATMREAKQWAARMESQRLAVVKSNRACGVMP